MRNIKAVILGIAFIAFAMLVMQLAYIFLAVGYNELAKSMPFLNSINNYFRYLIGMPVFILILMTGGYVTAATAESYRLILSFIVGMLTVGVMLASAIYDYVLTPSGYFLFTVGIFLPMAGGWYWQRKHLIQQENN
ncbi:MAG: hypothetical protein OQK73_02140 [Gammaproteobacteria bacterium]|nr:hypothetical protein [Gammaproteobacteria bacterium]